MASGILTKNTILHNHAMEIRVPKQTIVDMTTIAGTPTIFFRDKQLKCHKVNGQWFAELGQQLILLQFPKGKQTPYPFAYFGKEIA